MRRLRSKNNVSLFIALFIIGFLFIAFGFEEENRPQLLFNFITTHLNNVRNNLLRRDSTSTVAQHYGPNEPNIELINFEDPDAFHGNIIILITSHIANKNRRQSIRRNWGDSNRFTQHRQKYNNVTYKEYFMTGYQERHIDEAKAESVLHKDVLIANRTEDYWDLSRRVMLGFLWSLEHCTFDFLLKADDDVFINIPNLFELIYTDEYVLEYKDRIYMGLIKRKNNPVRDIFSKWYVSRVEWAPDEYPLFATGMGYVLSRLVVEEMRQHFDWVNPFRFEDVYIGMLINRAKIPGIGIRIAKTENEFSGYNSAKECTYIKSAITHHKVTLDWCMVKLTSLSVQNSS